MKYAIFMMTSMGLMVSAHAVGAENPQSNLPITLNSGDSVLEYDWPILSVGTGQYEDGPTGVTVFHFKDKVYSAVDARGGGPGTVNAPYMDLGYDMPELDTVVLSGGSWYGLETVTAVASALKDDGLANGDAFGDPTGIAMSVGSIIFDFGGRRLNEIYPDKRLAQAAFRSAQSGKFPLGAQGAGRFALTGGYFGCNAKSGQGGAFQQVGELKIAAFTVVNALGAVVDREGKVVACYGDEGWPEEISAAELIKIRSDDIAQGLANENAERKNTTVSLVVVNQKLSPPELKRLAVQVHNSMSRAIQPFGSIYDGDVLYAVSTAEVEEQILPALDLGVLASEVMWDAIISAVPEQPVAPKVDPGLSLDKDHLATLEGVYKFGPEVSVKVDVRRGKLMARATGEKSAFAIGADQWKELLAVTPSDFTVPGRYPFMIRFHDEGAVLNPGHWQQVGQKIQ